MEALEEIRKYKEEKILLIFSFQKYSSKRRQFSSMLHLLWILPISAMLQSLKGTDQAVKSPSMVLSSIPSSSPLPPPSGLSISYVKEESPSNYSVLPALEVGDAMPVISISW